MMDVGQLIHQLELPFYLVVEICRYILDKGLYGGNIPILCLEIHSGHHVFKIVAESPDLML